MSRTGISGIYGLRWKTVNGGRWPVAWPTDWEVPPYSEHVILWAAMGRRGPVQFDNDVGAWMIHAKACWLQEMGIGSKSAACGYIPAEMLEGVYRTLKTWEQLMGGGPDVR